MKTFQKEEDDLKLDDIKIHDVIVDKPDNDLPYSSPVEIIMDSLAWQMITQHAREDLRKEAGGIMLGNIYQYEGKLAVRITSAVPARQAVRDAASIKFTYEAWQQMEAERHQRGHTEKLIGWYHTHPGFGSHFSEMDYFLHENFFAQPWHVALLIDPMRGEHRFYRWENNKLVSVIDFLLQITNWPGPEAPPKATLPPALRQTASRIQGEGDRDVSFLQSTLKGLARRISSIRSESSDQDVLSLVVACAEMDPTAIATARKLIQSTSFTDRPIDFSELSYCTRITDRTAKLDIRQGWLAELIGKNTAYFHGLADKRYFLKKLQLFFDCLDLSLDEWGCAFLLTGNSQSPIHLLLPSLPSWYEQNLRVTDVKPMLEPISINWYNIEPARGIGKIIIGNHYLYLLTLDKIYILYPSEQNILNMFSCIGYHNSSECGLNSFKTLTDWKVDLIGNLYLLIGQEKKVWRLDQLRGKAGLWHKLLIDDELKQPVSIAVGSEKFTVYDKGVSCLAEYNPNDGQLLSRRMISENFTHLGIHKIFSDGYKGLYFLTDSGIYYLPQ